VSNQIGVLDVYSIASKNDSITIKQVFKFTTGGNFNSLCILSGNTWKSHRNLYPW